ncbi:MAG: peptidoglycan DD-metalloendopeptidase family protein [Synergistales bacterium]|nr:peptidoglycan DD-metalloendopeptidase family protein [Synergistales bacterium]
MNGKALIAMIFSALALAIPSAEALTRQEVDQRLRQEEIRLAQIETQVSQHRQKMSETVRKEKSLLDELSVINEKTVVAAQKIVVLDLKQKKVTARIEDLETEIAMTRKDLAGVQELLQRRLLALYKYGNGTDLDLLLSMGDVQEALATTYLLKRITDQDRVFFEDLTRKSRRLEAALGELEEQRGELGKQRADLERQKKEYNQSLARRNKALEEIRRQKSNYEKAEKELVQAQTELEQRIRRLLQEKQRLAEEARRAALARPDQKPKEPMPTYKPGGKLRWPIKGRVMSPFGTRVHPTFKTKTVHTGIDIDGKRGDPVGAAAAGEVLFAGWLRGYGQIVVLDHGGDLTTVYAHLSKISVAEGDRVTVGQTIGLVGDTGVATGHHLHFEVRVNGEARDPMRYLGGR